MKKKLILIIFLIINMVAIGIKSSYAEDGANIVYIYKSTSSIYGGSNDKPIDIPIPEGHKYKENEKGYISIQDKQNQNLVYVWVPLSDTSKKDELWENIYMKYKENNKTISSNTEIYKKLKYSKEKLSNEFINSIKEYKGFYVSEAELSFDKQNKFYNRARGMVDNSVTNTQEEGDYYRATNYTYKQMEEKAKDVTSGNKTINSHLLYGVEWDAMLLWIAKTNSNYIDSKGNDIYKVLAVNSTYVGKYSNSDLEDTISKNETEYFNGIWGIGGNLAEITQETYNGKQVIRGGSFNTTGESSPIASRDVTDNLERDDIGFRTALYIIPGLEKKELKINDDINEGNSSNDNTTDIGEQNTNNVDNEVDELDELEYESIEGKWGSNDYNHTSSRNVISKIL